MEEDLKKILTEENIKKMGAMGIIDLVLPPMRQMKDHITSLEEELRVARIRNEEQAKVLDAIVKSLKV